MPDFALKSAINVGVLIFCIININLSHNEDHSTRTLLVNRTHK